MGRHAKANARRVMAATPYRVGEAELRHPSTGHACGVAEADVAAGFAAGDPDGEGLRAFRVADCDGKEYAVGVGSSPEHALGLAVVDLRAHLGALEGTVRENARVQTQTVDLVGESLDARRLAVTALWLCGLTWLAVVVGLVVSAVAR